MADESLSSGALTPVRVRARLARLTSQRHQVDPALEPLCRTVRTTHPKADISVLEKAYTTAAQAHAGQKRKSGDPYITHPLAVATILAELGMTPPTLAAALLHDTVEDTDYGLDELRRDFGDEITMLVDGVTKLDKVKYGQAAQAETVRKMVVAMAKDIRVLVIKLADRLHNARTWRYVPKESALRKARETLEIYAPLAHRLGMNTIKWELEDLSFAILHPKVYDEIVRLVAERAPSRDDYLASVIEQVEEDLGESKLKASVTGRPKHYYSIYQKMIVRGRDFADIYDLVGIRILVESVRDCYAVLGVVHARWNPVPGRFKDFIAMPKFNMYQSLHTTVIGPGGKPVELQIRTFAMHRRAEYGIAAHWKYKEDSKAIIVDRKAITNGASDTLAPGDMAWLRQLLDWQKETEDPGEFLESLRFEIESNEVYVFTPRGDVVALPARSTPVDFAYAVHTEVGHSTVGARVNGRLVPLDSTLSSGDSVEVFTSKVEGAGPSRDWLQIVATPRAAAKIRQWFSRERREDAIGSGKADLIKALRREGLPVQKIQSGSTLLDVAKAMNYADEDALYAAIGEHHVSAQSVTERVTKELYSGPPPEVDDDLPLAIPQRPSDKRRKEPTSSGIHVEGMDDLMVRLSRCCTPVPGDDVVGFVTRGRGVSVHRNDCANAVSLADGQADRMIDVEWDLDPQGAFIASIEVKALDRSRLLRDVTASFGDQRVNILSCTTQTSDDRVSTMRFDAELGEASHLDSLLSTIRGVEGVYDAYRVVPGRGS